MGILASIGVRLLEIMFGVGVMGSAIVLVLTTSDDADTLLGSNTAGSTDSAA